MTQVEREFAASARTPGAARAFARSALGELLDPPVPAELCDDLELVISELVTNAVRAASPTVLVTIALEGRHIVVRVRDEAVGWPKERLAAADDPGGRGLPLVTALSSTWGVRPLGDSAGTAATSGSAGTAGSASSAGKVVWAELAVPPD